MEKRIHIFIALGITTILFILGSFYDEAISQELYIENFTFGIIISAFGLVLTYSVSAMFAGLLLGEALKLQNRKLKILISICTALFLLVIIYLCGDTVFDENGFNKKGFGYKALGIGIFAIILPIFYYLGFRQSKKITNDKLWLILSIIIIGAVIALLAGALGIKEIFHRPRFRTVVKEIEGIEFHKWWVPFKDYKNYITADITKEEFKSFPSGHATTSMIAVFGLSYLFLFDPRLKKYQTYLFYLGVTYSYYISLTRILAGAHFLSDVACGSIISLVFFFITNEIIIRKKLLEDNINIE